MRCMQEISPQGAFVASICIVRSVVDRFPMGCSLSLQPLAPIPQTGGEHVLSRFLLQRTLVHLQKVTKTGQTPGIASDETNERDITTLKLRSSSREDCTARRRSSDMLRPTISATMPS